MFSKFLVYEDAKVSINVPVNSLDLHVFSNAVKGGRIEDKDGRAQWVWNFENHDPVVPELNWVDALDYAPRIVVSTFKDYAAIAAAYEERARPKARVTEKVRALADELTTNIVDSRGKAKALYTWVAQNIRFAGNYMGVGSVVPHDVDEILANRLGDCKDHVVLLQALLEAVGIESSPVLINSGSSFKLPDVASTTPLDHVITYISSLDLYVDSTSRYCPFGLLPLSDCGKPAVHTSKYTESSKLLMSPLKYDTLCSTTKMSLDIHDDGSGWTAK